MRQKILAAIKAGADTTWIQEHWKEIPIGPESKIIYESIPDETVRKLAMENLGEEAEEEEEKKTEDPMPLQHKTPNRVVQSVLRELVSNVDDLTRDDAARLGPIADAGESADPDIAMADARDSLGMAPAETKQKIEVVTGNLYKTNLGTIEITGQDRGTIEYTIHSENGKFESITSNRSDLNAAELLPKPMERRKPRMSHRAPVTDTADRGRAVKSPKMLFVSDERMAQLGIPRELFPHVRQGADLRTFGRYADSVMKLAKEYETQTQTQTHQTPRTLQTPLTSTYKDPRASTGYKLSRRQHRARARAI